LFADNNVIDPTGTRAVVSFALEAGAHGVVFPGVASECNFLTPDEREQLLAAVWSEVGGRVPIVGGASASTSAAAIVAGQQAAEQGIDHLMIMAPSGLGRDMPAQHDFFATISRELTDVQIILQNAPPPIGAGLSASAIESLTAANPAITYVKEETLPSGPAITALGAAGIAHLKGVFGGGGARYLIDELGRGALGAMPAVELTDLHVAIYAAQQAGEYQQARQLYRLSLPLLACHMIYRMRLTKYVLKQRGIANCLHVRAPLPELDEFARKDVDNMLADLRKSFHGPS
jgi:4-hydroxy-tetrahydrodipicolinate synthase